MVNQNFFSVETLILSDLAINQTNEQEPDSQGIRLSVYKKIKRLSRGSPAATLLW